MKQVKTMKFPHSSEVYEIIDAKAREDIKNLKDGATTTVTDDGNGNVVLTNVAIEEGEVLETDPTVPAWAKQPQKPTYTATEVGARPDDWTPTESDPTVPAWAKTPEKPAYGWSEITDKPFTNGKLNTECLPDDIGGGAAVTTLTSSHDLNTIRQCGWYAWSSDYPVNAPLIGEYRTNCYMRVDSHLDGQSCVQTIWSNNEDAAGCFVRRQIRNNTLGEWEWTEPPMAVGVEYRTTERWLGYPVYTRLVDCGTIGSATVPKEIQISGLDLNTTSMIRYCGTSGMGAMPYIMDTTLAGAKNAWFCASQNIIKVFAGSSRTNPATYHYRCRVWYIKVKIDE